MWTVIARPKGENPSSRGKNDGGMIVLLTNGTEEQEVGRVLWKRRNSLNPRTRFKAALQDEVETAQHSADEANRLQEAADKALAEAASAEQRMLSRSSGGLR